MPYRDEQGVPPGYHLETRLRKGPVIAGSIMLGAGYLGSVAAATQFLANEGDDGSDAWPLFIPIAGPFITLGNLDFNDNEWGGLLFVVAGIPLILDGLLQTGGAALLIGGLASPKQIIKRDGSALVDTTPHLRFGGNRIMIEGRF